MPFNFQNIVEQMHLPGHSNYLSTSVYYPAQRFERHPCDCSCQPSKRALLWWVHRDLQNVSAWLPNHHHRSTTASHRQWRPKFLSGKTERWKITKCASQFPILFCTIAWSTILNQNKFIRRANFFWSVHFCNIDHRGELRNNGLCFDWWF